MQVGLLLMIRMVLQIQLLIIDPIRKYCIHRWPFERERALKLFEDTQAKQGKIIFDGVVRIHYP